MKSPSNDPDAIPPAPPGSAPPPTPPLNDSVNINDLDRCISEESDSNVDSNIDANLVDPNLANIDAGNVSANSAPKKREFLTVHADDLCPQKLRIIGCNVTPQRLGAAKKELLGVLGGVRQRFGEPCYSLDMGHNLEIDEGDWVSLLSEVLGTFSECKAIKMSHNVIGETFILQVG